MVHDPSLPPHMAWRICVDRARVSLNHAEILDEELGPAFANVKPGDVRIEPGHQACLDDRPAARVAVQPLKRIDVAALRALAHQPSIAQQVHVLVSNIPRHHKLVVVEEATPGEVLPAHPVLLRRPVFERIEHGHVVTWIAFRKFPLGRVGSLLVLHGRNKDCALREDGGDGHHRVEAAKDASHDQGFPDLGAHWQGGQALAQRSERLRRRVQGSNTEE
mmetsp:Transcript_13849/g.44314  ORF Transcript_13849/g.44314 Transcript_13849/m.44314 type:complete len:219 (-) Transcript_13849:1075-1731(-)